MKTYLFFFFVLLQGITNAQTHILTDEKQIRQVLKLQQSAWNNGNIPEFMEGYWKSDSLSFIGKKGITRGWKQTLENYQKSYPDKATMGNLQFDILSVELFSKTSAQVVGRWELHREIEKGNVGGYFTLIFKKINKRWVIVSDHTS